MTVDVIVKAFSLGQAASSVVQVDNGFGRHHHYMQQHPDQEASVIRFTIIINAMLQTVGTFFVRTSVALLVLRMPPVGHSKQLHSRWIYILMVFFGIVSAVTILVLGFQCVSIGDWEFSLEGSCVGQTNMEDVLRAIGGGFKDFFVHTRNTVHTWHSFDNRHGLSLRQPPSHLPEGRPISS